MTATFPQQRRTRVRRPGKVYAYLTLRHNDPSVIEFGYAGQTRQQHRGRDTQHRDEQPWSDLIVGDPIVIADGWWSDKELDAIEQAVIAGDWAKVLDLAAAEYQRRTGNRNAQPPVGGMRSVQQHGMRPRYNIDHNMDNPDRIPPWEAQAQRRQRDARRGVTEWQPRPPIPSRAPETALLPLTVWQLWLVAWVPLWCVAGVWTSSVWWGAGLSAGLLAWGVRQGRGRRRRRR